MSTDCHSLENQSSSSEEEEAQLSFQPITSPIDGDADDSDNGNPPIPSKSRRFQKTRKSSNSSLSQKTETINNTTVSTQQTSSSNDEEKKNSTVMSNGNGERRTKPLSTKKLGHSCLTTTDDDSTKIIHRYQPLVNHQERLLPTTHESSPTPNNGTGNSQPAVKKVNRFQVKSIRKSQQQILLANTSAAKSSNEDDCSVPNGKSQSPLQPSIVGRQHTNTPTTDGENSLVNTDNLVHRALSKLQNVENGHAHVRFHIAQQEKKDSINEEEKPPNQATLSLPAPTPPHHSSAASIHGEVRHLFPPKKNKTENQNTESFF